MAIVNFGSVESGTFSEFAATSGTVSVSSAQAKYGTYSLQVNPTTTGIGRGRIRGFTGAGGSGNINLADSYWGFWFRAATLPAANSEEMFKVLGASSTSKLHVRVNSSGNLMAFATDGTTQLGSTGSTALATNTWYYISAHCGTGASAAFTVYINDVSEISSTGDLNTQNAISADLGKTTNRNSQTVDFFYDAWTIDDATIPTSTPQFALLKPTGNGANTAWARGGTDSGADWSQLSEIPANDAEYVVSTAQNDRESVTLTSSATAGVSGTIHVIKPQLIVGRDGASNGTVAASIRSGGSDSDGANFTAPETPELLCRVDGSSRVLAVDPTDSNAWTTTKLDALELGIIDKNASNRSRWTWGAVDVMFTPASGVTVPLMDHHYRMLRAG